MAGDTIPRRNAEINACLLAVGGQLKGIGDMSHPDPLPLDQNAYHVEAVGFPNPAMAADPGPRRTCQLALLAPVHGLDGIPEVRPTTGFDLHEGDEPAALDDEVDIAVS